MNESLTHSPRLRAGSEAKSPAKLIDCHQLNKIESLRDLSLPPIAVAQDFGGIAPLGTHSEITGHFRAKTSKRDERFALQTTARELLDGAPHPRSNKGYRIAHCQRSVIMDGEVKIMAGPNGKAKFGGLQNCGSVWCCALCSCKIMRLREAEISKGMNTHFAAGGGAVMVTYTHPHKRHDVLAVMVDKFSKATRMLTGLRAYKDLLRFYGMVGKIRAQEVTFGFENGWHNHTHEAWLLEKHLTKAMADALQNALFDLWKKCCVKVGLPAPSRKHGVDVRIAYSPQEYLTKFDRAQKWGTGAELAKSSLKKSDDRYTPFDFLRAYQAGHKRDEMRRLFREYAFGMFGSRQIHWSKGLKKRLEIEEKTDEELAAETEAKHIEVGAIGRTDWRRVINQPKDVRPEVLRQFEKGGMDAVRKFISGLSTFISDRGKDGKRVWIDVSSGEVI